MTKVYSDEPKLDESIVEFFNTNAAKADYTYLGDLGIVGNGHVMMSEYAETVSLLTSPISKSIGENEGKVARRRTASRTTAPTISFSAVVTIPRRPKTRWLWAQSLEGAGRSAAAMVRMFVAVYLASPPAAAKYGASLSYNT